MELATEHVRMLDAGRQRVAYSSPLSTACFASVASARTQLLQHGNAFGLSFVATEQGFAVAKNDALEAASADYNTRRQEAVDHGQKLTLEEIHELPTAKQVQLPAIAYWIALSPDELTLAVAYADAVALFEVAHILEAASPAPFQTFAKLQAQEIAWCSDAASERLAVLTLEKQVVVCSLDGGRKVIDTQSAASSISWSPSGEEIAIGLVNGMIGLYGRNSLQIIRTIDPPEGCAGGDLEVHHVNWAEDELFLAGYQRYDEVDEETTAMACIFDGDKCVELDEVVGFFDVENRRHQYFSAFLPDWRMFFIGCSLSADIELLVSDPDGGEWELWKPLEKYQARLPMNAEDEESYPMGLALNLNSTSPVSVDEDTFPPVPIVSCANTDGLLVNFAFVDTTVQEVDFIKSPSPFEATATREVELKEKTAGNEFQFTANTTPQAKPASPKKEISHEYGQNDENEFAESDGESSDEEEERKEEEEKARSTFRTIASEGTDFIVSEQFPKLFKAMGSTYSEEEHASTLEGLEKDGKVYESDFASWYVNWIFGDDDSGSDDDEDAPSSLVAKPAEMKSKEEIAAAFSKFTVKEGSWKCDMCMVSNGPDAMKCSACETPNPAAPKALAPVTAASVTSAGSIGSGGFSFPIVTGDASKPSSFSFGATPATSSNGDASNKPATGFSFGGAAGTTGFSFPSSTSTTGTGFSFSTSSKPATGFNFAAPTNATTTSPGTGFSFGSLDSESSSKAVPALNTPTKLFPPSSPKKAVSHKYGQNDENEFAESDGESSDEEEERKEEEEKARKAFRSIACDGNDFIASEQFPKLFKTLGSTYSEEEHASTLHTLENDGKVYEIDFVSWYVDWIFGEDESDSDDDTAGPVSPKKEISHEYGQNDENEFAESDGESSDEEEERKEEEEKARSTFRTIASEGTDFIVSEQFPKLFKAMGSTYSEEEHASTLEGLEKDGKVYESDFASWYVNWIFGDDDSDSDDDEDAPSSLVAKPAEMKSKEEIAAAFSKFTVKEGSWKCDMCMVSNGPDAMKCSACETPNPAAPKALAPVTAASVTSAGSIGSGGFSFPIATGDASKPSSFSFGATPATSSNGDASNKPATGFSFGGAAGTTGFSFPSSTSTTGTGFSFPTNSKPATGFNFAAPASAAASTATSDMTSKPKPPPAFGAASSGAYPPDTTSKPKPPAFGASSGYPPDTTSKPKPPAFGAASGGAYPPDTTSKPKPPAFGASSGYPPDTTSKPKPPAFGASSGYPPDTTSKPTPPAFGASSGYPPDTTSKPKPPAFGAANGGAYPPDTTSKPKPPAFGASSGGAYPPDTTSKPKPPAFGAASGGAYPPDTTSKPKPPAFGASSGYPPDTTSKPKPPAFGAPDGTSAFGSGFSFSTTAKPATGFSFGAATISTAASSSYPPDTMSKPKPPAFGATSGSGYPPDTTSKPKPPMFGQPTTSDKPTSSFGFGSFGKSLFGSKTETESSSESTEQTTPKKTKSLFGSNGAAEKAPDTSSSPFGVVPKATSKSAFSFGAASIGESKGSMAKTSTTRPSFSFDNVSSTLGSTAKDNSEDEPKTKRTLNFGDSSALKTHTKPVIASVKPSKAIPSSRMEGQLWKLIVDFDKSLQRVNQSSKDISSKNPEFSKDLMAKTDKLRAQISSLCDEINNLDESRDQIEKDVLFVIGSDGDVHEQLEYGREILNSFNDEALKRTLEEQPLDQRSKETRESLKEKLEEVEKCCRELDSHLSSSKIGTDGAGTTSSAHLFRVLKQTYDNSKMQYNKACKLADQLEKLSLRGDRMRQTNGVSGFSAVESEAHSMATKEEMIQVITETEERSQGVRRNFLSLCNNVVTPRDVFSTPRRKLAPPTPSDSSTSPLRIKACSKLMPKTQLSVASPMSSAKQSSRSVSFKTTPVKSGSKLFSLAEAMAPKEEPAKLVQTPQPIKPSVGVGKAPQRPSLGSPAAEAKPASTASAAAPKSNAFSFPKSSKGSAFGASVATDGDKNTASTTSAFGGFGVNSPAVKPKPKAEAKPAPAFTLGGKEAPPSSSAFTFGSKDSKSTGQAPSTASSATDYKALLEKFYKVHNPSKTGSVIEKALATYKGREEDLFSRLFTMYVPDSTPDDVKKYLSGGSVPPKSTSATAASKSPAPANTASKSPFSSFGPSTTAQKDSATKPSPFGASPSAFSLGPAANKSSGFGSFGSTATSSTTTPTTTATASPFGKPAVDYRQKLVEFYQKHNPDKLSSVDATLQKYKGNEEKLFQNLAVKYKLNDASGGISVPPASPAVQPAKPNAAASPFGQPAAFGAASTATFGSTSSVGFGAAKPAPGASPFGAPKPTPAASPFGATAQTSSGFGSASGGGFGSGFQSSAPTTPAFGAPSPFGATSGGFGAAAGGVNYREKLTAFYQQHNPAKLSSVDATLEKYKGREDHLFSMLEQKYVNKQPAAPATGGFGIPSTSTFGGGSGFGTPSALGSASAAPAFGSASSLGSAAQPAFGGAAGSGFGMASRMGGGSGFGSAAPSGGAAGSGFSAFGAQTSTFGGAAQQQSGGFGAAANSGGFGSGFGGGAATGGFGQPAAFSNPSFTQMR
ncbi:Nuclear pore complex protein [Phytophthora cinnamomi]|uniref:Nuclear pore complex protein n=1 Tax=Phytophthora cinnamomi TaxID=4785 RepID=UPI003559CF52|nr:Nuclear pore complex protein [Phytophthora cinnamomi]